MDGIDYKSLYSLVMHDMKTKFDAKELTDDQKTEATRVTTETQKRLGDTSFDGWAWRGGTRASPRCWPC